MCTVTFFPKSDGSYILGMNRDEQRTRSPALELKYERASRPSFAYPLDPEAGGTWIGINGEGLTLVLLNVTPSGDNGVLPKPATSRGLIIPRLISSGSIAEVRQAAEIFDTGQFAPFILAAFSEKEQKIATFERNGKDLNETNPPWKHFFMTSSSFDSNQVQSYRRNLFRALIEETSGVDREGLVRFHRDQTKSWEAESVFMTRQDARTVSFSLVERTNGLSRLSYEVFSEGHVPDQSAAFNPNHRIDLRDSA